MSTTFLGPFVAQCRNPIPRFSGGLLTRTMIMCQCHGSQFDIVTGAVVNGPATKALHVYDVREVEGTVRIRV